MTKLKGQCNRDTYCTKMYQFHILGDILTVKLIMKVVKINAFWYRQRHLLLCCLRPLKVNLKFTSASQKTMGMKEICISWKRMPDLNFSQRTYAGTGSPPITHACSVSFSINACWFWIFPTTFPWRHNRPVRSCSTCILYDVAAPWTTWTFIKLKTDVILPQYKRDYAPYFEFIRSPKLLNRMSIFNIKDTTHISNLLCPQVGVHMC